MPLTNILQKIFLDQKQVKLSSAERYKELLHKYASAGKQSTSEDERRLAELIAELNISEAQAVADANAIHQFYELTELTLDIDTHKDSSRLAHEAHQKAFKERQDNFHKQNQNCVIANSKLDDATEKLQRSERAVETIRQLENAHPHLFTR